MTFHRAAPLFKVSPKWDRSPVFSRICPAAYVQILHIFDRYGGISVPLAPREAIQTMPDRRLNSG